MNKMRERGRKATAATLACVQQCHVDASIKTFHKCQKKRAAIQPSPHKEPLWLSAHAHGIKSLIKKYFYVTEAA